MLNDSQVHTAPIGEKSPGKLVFAAALGAFILGFGDLLNNDKSATVIKIAEVIRQYLYPELMYGALISLMMIVILGCGICWVHQPHTRHDAFTRGLSVFAVLAVITPYELPPGGLDSKLPQKVTFDRQFSIFSSAWAEGSDMTLKIKEKNKFSLKGEAVITLRTPDKKDSIYFSTVTVREPRSARIIAVERVYGSSFSLIKPIGNYLLEIESPGHKRTRTNVLVNEGFKKYSLPIENTIIPLSIQRLYPPQEVTLKNDKELELIPSWRKE